jgi:DNA-binding transcriptional LysR family regulator
MSWSPSHLLVWANSRSNGFPVGGITLPSVNDPALAVVAAPVELEPFQYFMVWHPRLDHDPAQQWLRDTIRSVAAVTVSGSRSRR